MTEHTLQADSFDMGTSPSERPTIPPATSVGELLARFDENVSTARRLIAAMEGPARQVSWTLLQDGTPSFTMPRFAVFRSFIMNHTIHHRAQLCVYLRMLNIPVPALYGPSADERPR